MVIGNEGIDILTKSGIKDMSHNPVAHGSNAEV